MDLKRYLTIIICLIILTTGCNVMAINGLDDQDQEEQIERSDSIDLHSTRDTDIFDGYSWDGAMNLSLTTAGNNAPMIAVTPSGLSYVTWWSSGSFYLTTVEDGEVSLFEKRIVEQDIPILNNQREYGRYMDVDSSGRLHMVLGSAWSSDTYHRFDENGNPDTSPFQLGADVQVHQAIKVSGDDTAYVLFTDNARDVRLSAIDKRGTSVVQDALVIDADWGGNPKNSFDVDDEPKLRIVSFDSNANQYDYVKADKDGNQVLEKALFSTSGWDPPLASVASTPDGMNHIVWSDGHTDGNLRYMRVNDTGLLDTGPWTIPYTSCDNPPRIAGDRNGDAYIVWSDPGPSNNTIRLTRVEKGVDQPPTEIYNVSDGTHPANFPALDIDDENNLHISWMENHQQSNPIRYRKASASTGLDAYFTSDEVEKAKEIGPGQEKSIELTVKNTGVVPDKYIIRPVVDLFPGWTLEAASDRLHLIRNESAKIDIVIGAPTGAKEGQNLTFKFEVASTKHLSVAQITDTVRSTVVVRHNLTLEVNDPSRVLDPGQEAVFDVEVSNLGDVKEFAYLDMDLSGDWTVSYEPEWFSIEPSDPVSVGLRLGTSNSTMADSYGLEVALRYTGNHTRADVTTITVVVQTNRDLGIAADRMAKLAHSHLTTEFEITVTNENNMNETAEAHMGTLSEYSVDLLSVNFSRSSMNIGPGDSETTILYVTPFMKAEAGKEIEFTVYATIYEPERLEAVMNLTLTMVESLVILQADDTEKTVQPASVTEFDFTLTNGGELEENVMMEVVDLPSGWNSSVEMLDGQPSTDVHLDGYERLPGTLTVAVPSDRSKLGSIFGFRLEASYGDKDTGVDLSVLLKDPGANNTEPEFISLPETRAVIDSEYVYWAEATDPDAGDVVTYALMEGPPGMTVDTNSGKVSWIPDSDAIGEHDILIRALDRLSSTDQSFTLEVVLPTLGEDLQCEILEPEEGDEFSGHIRISGKAVFPGLGGVVQIRVDDGDWMTAKGGELWYLEMDMRDHGEGEHTIWARAVLEDGNSTPVSVDIEVESISGQTSQDTLGGDWLPILLILIIVLVTVTLLFRRRLFPARSPMEEETGTPDDLEEPADEDWEHDEEEMDDPGEDLDVLPLLEEDDGGIDEEEMPPEDIEEKEMVEEIGEVEGAQINEPEEDESIGDRDLVDDLMDKAGAEREGEVEDIKMEGETVFEKRETVAEEIEGERGIERGKEPDSVDDAREPTISELEKEFEKEERRSGDIKREKGKREDVDLDSLLEKLKGGGS